MGSMSFVHWLLVGILVLLLFGKGRFSDMMGDVAKGIKSFKKGLAEDDDAKAAPRIEATATPPAPVTIEAEKHTDKPA
ncbi:MAG: twin-arginine translocase TatA/TatE family subunit [Chakrabartia sp.]